MNFIFIGLLIILLIWISVLISNLKNGLQGFTFLLEKFTEINQPFYEDQKNIVKKEKENFESLIKLTSEIEILRRYSNQLSLSLRSLGEVAKTLKDIQKDIKSIADELVVSKDIAISLATVSNNIKLLDKIVEELRTLKNAK